jgi:radical SAM superfamily enzyme YgiQ (UPF0313 family)
MKVIFLNPPSRVTRNVVRDVLYGCWCKGKRIGGGTVPPLALLSVATVARSSDIDIEFLDAAGEGISHDEIRSRIDHYDLVVCSTSTMTFNEDVRLLYELKMRNPSLLTVIFGSHPTFMPIDSLKREGVDIVVRKEPEYIIKELLSFLTRGDPSWRQVKGIGFKEEGRIVLNDYHPFIQDLDELPFLDVDLLPKDVIYFNPIVRHYPYITTITSRGCHGRCIFCPAPHFYGSRIRARSAENVVEEISFYLSKGYKDIYFRDETFTFNKERVALICDLILTKNLSFGWICNARVGTIDRELLVLMKRAGCYLIKFGVESGVQEILDASNKGISVDETRRNFEWAREVGIDTHAHLMLGMPGETKETLIETIRFAKEIAPTTATFGICTPYPGTPLFDRISKIYPEIRDGTEADLSQLHTKAFFNEEFTSLSREELERSIRIAYRSFYLRPSYLFGWIRRIKGVRDMSRILLSGLRVLEFSLVGE